MGRNSYYYALMFLSCLCSDNVFVPVDKDLTEEQMTNLINHSESEVLFLDTKYAEIPKAIREEKQISDATESLLKKAIEEFKKEFRG